MTDNFNIALVGLAGIIAGNTLAHVYSRIREKVTSEKKKLETARLAKTELISLANHSKSNLIVLFELRINNSFGKKVSYKKFKYSKKGYISLDMPSIKDLPERLSHELLRMSLFVRNNELEVQDAMRCIFNDDNNDTEKWEKILSLIYRFEVTKNKALEISKLLDKYIENSRTYKDEYTEWRDIRYDEFKRIYNEKFNQGSPKLTG